MSEMKWCNYPEEKPTEHGYYYTLYMNYDEGREFYKSIYWDGKEWSPWRPGGGPKLEVIKYAPETKALYYTESLQIMRTFYND